MSSRRLLWRVIGLLVVAAAVWLPRGLALDHFVTPDESYWLARSANFSQALAHGDFSHTYQFFHPGVTTMWLGSAGFLVADRTYARDADSQVRQVSNDIVPLLRERGIEPLDVLAAGRKAVVLAQTLILAAACWYAMRLFGVAVAIFGFLLIALDPFHVGLSRLLHVDGLTSSLTLLTLLAAASYIYGDHRRRDLVVAGIAAGLAWLTRSTALFLLPFVGLMLLFAPPGIGREPRQWLAALRRALPPYALWLGVGMATSVLLWPALWVSPIETVSEVIRGALSSAEEGHRREIFFNGTVYQGDPGWHFYPITFLWRTTPTVLLGLIPALALLLWPGMTPPRVRRPLIALLFFAVAFTAFMSLGAKKFDRYLLPVYAPLDLVAAWGWVTLLQRSRSVGRWVAPAAAAIGLALIGGNAAITAAAYPYYLSAYNPLLGGNAAARDVMMIGWGEGLDQVGRYLADLQNSEEIRVRTRAWPQPLSYFFQGRIWEDNFSPDRRGLLRWATADYYVLDLTSIQRGWIPQELLAFFDEQQPVFVAQIEGIEYARVYDVRRLPVPDYFLTPATGMTDWDGRVRLAASEIDWGPVPRGGRARIAIFVEARAPGAEDLGLRVRLVTADGQEIARTTAELRPRGRTLWRVGAPIPIPQDAPVGVYRVMVSFTDLTTGSALAATDAITNESLGTEVVAGVVIVADPHHRIPSGLSP